MADNDDSSAKDNPTASGDVASGNQPNVSAGNITDNTGNTAVGSNINQNYAARDQFSGGNIQGGVVNIYYGSDGNPKTSTSGGSGSGSATTQPSGGQQGGASTTMPLNIIGLNNVMRRSLNANTMLNICQIIAASSPYCSDLDYEGLAGSGWQNKTLSLIDYCRRRRGLVLLVDTINDTVGNAMLNPSHDDWHNWAAGEDAK